MALESPFTGKYIDDLVAANPEATDVKSQGDDHIRGVKLVLQNTFPNMSGAVATTDVELNYLNGVTPGVNVESKVPVLDAEKDLELGTGDVNCTDVTATGTVTGAALAGPLTGNVTGNVSGSALTVTQASQPAITDIGTQTSADIDGGAIDGTPIGANAAAAITGTTVVANTSLVANGVVSGTAFTVIDMGSPIDSTLTSVAHGLSSAPKIRCIYLECDSAEKGYSIGDRIWISGFSRGDLHFHADATNLNYWWDISAEALWDITGGIFQEINGTSPGTFTPASWTIYAEAGL